MRAFQVSLTKLRIEKKPRDRLKEDSPVVVPDKVQVHPVVDDDLSAYSDLKVKLRGGMLCAGKPQMPQYLTQASERQFALYEGRHTVSRISDDALSTGLLVIVIGSWQEICGRGAISLSQHVGCELQATLLEGWTGF